MIVKTYFRKLLWGLLYAGIAALLNYFLYPVILALFSAFFGTETLWINLVPAWPALILWIAAYNFRVNRSEARRTYLSLLGETRPTPKETLRHLFRAHELLLDFLAFLTVLFVYIIYILLYTHSIGLCMFYFLVYTPLYVLIDTAVWYLVHRHWQKDKY